MKHLKTTVLPYRPCVGIMMINKAGEVFMGLRVGSVQEHWQMPQGGIDEGEEGEQAALRELYEETGAKTVRVLTVSKHWYSYEVPDFLRPKFWNGMYRGQNQKWFLVSFEGEESELNVALMPVGTNPFETHQEFSRWKWAKLEEVVPLTVDFKRPIYQAVINEFLPFIETHKQQER